MSEIGRYEFMCSFPGSMSRQEDGPWITFIDHDRDVSEKVAAAVAAERKRCREQEVEPLIKAIGAACVTLHLHGLTDTADAVHRILAAVVTVQKERP
jgi:hypothetical protein